MSIINRMLQDLDRRNETADSSAEALPQQVRAVPRAEGARREWFWRILAVLLLAGVGWVGWVAWQLQPSPALATEEALKAGARLKASPPTVAVAPAGQSERPTPKLEVASPPPAPEPPRSVAAPEAAQQAPTPKAPEAPPAAKPAALAPAQASAASTRASQAPKSKPAPDAAPKAGVAAAPPGAPKAAASEAPKPSAAAPAAKIGIDVPPARILPTPPRAIARVQKKDRVIGPEELAEADFRRGVALLNQGRVSEAEELFHAALAASLKHEAARQALIALRLEQKRFEDARRLLQEGLAVNPANAQFAAVLARLHLERRDYAAALETLQAMPASQHAAPEIALLRAMALQRLGGRSAEAAEAFQSALRGAPQNGQAWLGLAISLESLGKTAEAADAFRRAAGSASLGADVRAYAEQRARQLQ